MEINKDREELLKKYHKYTEYILDLIDKCSECGGHPFYQQVNINKFVIQCDGCDQCVGPSDNRNALGWEWNRTQRSLNGNKISYSNSKRRRKRK